MNFKMGFASLLAGIAVLGAGQHLALADTGLSDAADPTAIDDSTGATNGNPYTLVVSRNVFHLNPQPPPPAAPTNTVVAGTIKLTGLIKSTGEPIRALFVNVAKEATNTTFYNLAEGERDRELELVKIHEDQEMAEVIHNGTHLTVMLKDSKPAGIPGAPGSAPAAAPGLAPGLAPAQVAQLNSSSRGGVGTAGNAGGVGVAGATPVTAPGTTPVTGAGTVPTRTIRTTPDVPYQPQTMEESVALMQIDAQKHADQINNGTYPPPPPPPGPPGGNTDNGNSAGPPGIPGLPAMPTGARRHF